MSTNTLNRESIIVSAQVPKTLALRLADLARENDRSVSAEIRRAVIEHLERERSTTA